MLCDKKHSHVQWRDFKMNVLVCDDDQQIVDSIIEELKKKSEETHVALRFYGFSQPSQIDLSLPYDIALLDIDMGETNGIELARKLRAENENIVIIFITNFIQYAPEGFEVQAFRYLLKADFSAKLDSYFDSAVQEVLQRKQLVTISINSEIIDVPVNDILYLESHRRIIVMHLLDEKRPAYQFYGNITELSEKIEPLGFLRIQKSYLVNMLDCNMESPMSFTRVLPLMMPLEFATTCCVTSNTAMMMSKVLEIIQTEMAVLKIHFISSAGSNCAMLLCCVIISINS